MVITSHHLCHIVLVKNMPQVLPILYRKDLDTRVKLEGGILGTPSSLCPEPFGVRFEATIHPPPFYDDRGVGDVDVEGQEATEGHFGWDSLDGLSAEVIFGQKCQHMKEPEVQNQHGMSRV